MTLRERALAEARDWIGTPYLHQGGARGVGSDCLGLLRGVWRALYGEAAEAPPPYRPDWAETGGEEALLKAAGRLLVPLQSGQAEPGDVLLFRIAPEACVKHCAIVSARAPKMRIIHAYWGRAVIESWAGPWWSRRVAAEFTWPSRPDAGGRL